MASTNVVTGNQAFFTTGAIMALSTTPADLSPAVTSKRQKLKAITITGDATCSVVLVDSAANTTPLASFGLLANTPLVLSENQLQDLVKTSVGGSLQIKATTGTPNVTASGVCDLE